MVQEISRDFRLAVSAVALLMCHCTAAADSENRFCGGAVEQTTPDDLAHVVGDMTLEYAVTQPASIVTCSKGYLLEKCGDHASANIIFDRCIAAGYVGAMIWKALMIEDGNGAGAAIEDAAELMHRAAVSDDPAYAPLGKMHYATMLYQGKGVPRDEEEAMRWFRAAAAEGNADAEEFLRTGYHSGERDAQGRGIGLPIVQGEKQLTATIPAAIAPASPPIGARSDSQTKADMAQTRRLSNQSHPSAVPRPASVVPGRDLDALAAGQRLARVAPVTLMNSPDSRAGLLFVLAALLAGFLHPLKVSSRRTTGPDRLLPARISS